MGSAKALGIDKSVGSLVVGKAADIQAVDMSAIESAPMYSVISHLVYCTGRSQVSDVWVNGKQLVKGRKLQTLDEGAVMVKAREWAAKAKEHATVPPVAAA
ncbi:metal-dependent hydrolase [Baffinella frigidus]|nr:metal-dependent hydrolase [Cryptophyta sp. CCMP2293]